MTGFRVTVNGRVVLRTNDRYEAENKADAESSNRPDVNVHVHED